MLLTRCVITLISPLSSVTAAIFFLTLEVLETKRFISREQVFHRIIYNKLVESLMDRSRMGSWWLPIQLNEEYLTTQLFISLTLMTATSFRSLTPWLSDLENNKI